MPSIVALDSSFDNVARRMRGRHFAVVAAALRSGIRAILAHWRAQSLKAMPDLEQFTVEQFEDSMASILTAIAAALETDDPVQLRRIIEEAPMHGADRIAQRFPVDALFGEAGILRSSIILELPKHMHRGLDEDEAAALHELIDLAFEHSALEFIRLRNLHRESETAQQVAGIRRLADLGTLVAGVAHDAANLLLPLRMGLDRLKHCQVDDEARSNIQTIEQIFRHFQNTIVNLRWLTVETAHQHREIAPLDLHEFARDYQQFLHSMLPRTVSLRIDIGDDVPPVCITAAAVSQILFNLVRNAQEAMIRHQEGSSVLIIARVQDDGRVLLAVEDDGPGMTPEARQRCFEPFYTTKPGEGGKAGGLGLSVVHAMVTQFDGVLRIHSPPLGKSSGTSFEITLKPASSEFGCKSAALSLPDKRVPE